MTINPPQIRIRNIVDLLVGIIILLVGSWAHTASSDMGKMKDDVVSIQNEHAAMKAAGTVNDKRLERIENKLDMLLEDRRR